MKSKEREVMVWFQQDMGLESILGHDVSTYRGKDQNMADLAIRRQEQPMNRRGPQQLMIDSISHGTYDQVGQSEKDTGVRKNQVDKRLGAQQGHRMSSRRKAGSLASC